MDTIRGCLEVLFKEIPNQEVSTNVGEENKSHNAFRIDKQLFLSYAYKIFPQYSKDEIIQVQEWVQDHLVENQSVFILLAKVGEDFLVCDNKEPQCKYEQILRWRDISFQLGQDLFTNAFLAAQDIRHCFDRKYFAWKPVLSSNNRRLTTILNRGLAENHFHLKGSTQVFQLSWICLMNHIIDREGEFQLISCYLEGKTLHTSVGIKVESLYESCIKAAKYRIALFLYLKEKDKIMTHSSDEENSTQNANIDMVDLKLLDLQRDINSVASQYGANINGNILDYTLEPSMLINNNNEQLLLAGERKFLYDCFLRCFNKTMGRFQQNIFYRYLLIKSRLRGELIQINRRVGFGNFSSYESRKELFIEKTQYASYTKELYRLAINSTLANQRIVSLETRVAPKDTTTNFQKSLKDIDDTVLSYQWRVTQNSLIRYQREKMNDEEYSIDASYFFVVHFIKSKEEKQKYTYYNPRHWVLRNKISKQTDVLAKFLQQDKIYGARVRGIDAANCEIGCRPEIFASCFRYLLNHTFECKNSNLDQTNIRKLYGTYHVGEDFLDLADGLRAIDEVLLFLDFKRGNRIGHALALGISSKKFYETKHGLIHIPKQDMLDNAVWLLEKVKEFGFPVENGLLIFLERIYYELFDELYQQYFDQRVTSYEYYQAWKLRGDDPEIYLHDASAMKRNMCNQMYDKEYYKINFTVPEQIRNNTVCRKLYYYYNYSKVTKEKGSKIYELKITDAYIKLVGKIQEKMIKQIYDRNIAIECNPSSNYLIGTIKKYDEHPLMRFNSFGLDEQDYPLLVSVNTDDQGVFDTSLENEYALLALALEKKKDDTGREKYTKEQVYQYIDYIRQLGIEQSFKCDDYTSILH